MMMKDKDILAEEPQETDKVKAQEDKAYRKLQKENMRAAWGDAFDAYLRGITEKYLLFRERTSRIDFWGFLTVSGLVAVALYFFGSFAEIPMLPYYYAAVTFIPTVAVCARRLHDVNKKAAFYLGGFVVMVILSVFVLKYIGILALGWFIFLVYLFSQEADPNEGLFGEPSDDSAYGADTKRIVGKFRTLALSFLCVEIGMTVVLFDNWSRQVTQKATIDVIMEQVGEQGTKAGLTEEQTKAAKTLMKEVLKNWQGKTVSEQDVISEINKAVKTIGEGVK